jgi:cell division FtsZ-interacting protein ZapD
MFDAAATRFLAAFRLRQACCRALLDLSKRQAALIAQHDYAELLDILKSKQALLDHLGQMAREQATLQTEWSIERGRIPSADRERCDAVLSETESLLANLIAEEQSSSTLLVSQRNATQRELLSLSAGIQAQQAYQSRSQPVASRFDLNT